MRKYLKSAAAILIIFMIFGCATTSNAPDWATRENEFMKNEQCRTAMKDAALKLDVPASRAIMAGFIFRDCEKNKQAAIKYFSLAARYGHPSAKNYLEEYGEPVPAADLAQSNNNSRKAGDESNVGLGLYFLNSAIQGWNAGAQRSNNEVDCTSIALGKDMVRTNCR